MKRWCIAAAVLAVNLVSPTAHARTLCTVIADAASGNVLMQEGDCATRVTPASTFKIALSLMGFDAGILKDEHTPTLPYRDGDVAWGGDAWRQPTDPARWIQYSVVWFSQRVAQSLGDTRFQHYADVFDYGNRDVSGEPGKHNGTAGAWINSSLQISPLEQVAFLRKVANLTITGESRDGVVVGDVNFESLNAGSGASTAAAGTALSTSGKTLGHRVLGGGLVPGYSASKGGVVSMTRALALELAPHSTIEIQDKHQPWPQRSVPNRARRARDRGDSAGIANNQ